MLFEIKSHQFPPQDIRVLSCTYLSHYLYKLENTLLSVCVCARVCTCTCVHALLISNFVCLLVWHHTLCNQIEAQQQQFLET